MLFQGTHDLTVMRIRLAHLQCCHAPQRRQKHFLQPCIALQHSQGPAGTCTGRYHDSMSRRPVLLSTVSLKVSHLGISIPLWAPVIPSRHLRPAFTPSAVPLHWGAQAQLAVALDPEPPCAPRDGLQRGHAAARWLCPDGRLDAWLCAGPVLWLAARLPVCHCVAVRWRSRGCAVLMRELNAGGMRQQAARCCLPSKCKVRPLIPFTMHRVLCM